MELSKDSILRTLDGVGTPVLGLGLSNFEENTAKEVEQAVLWALKHGYRLLDTAAFYE